ncbi:hypothetical protein N8876_01425 [Candidatus Pelagibacter sp.]|nr:hypothetical protein [Candidatus Pelagibacter sp.]
MKYFFLLLIITACSLDKNSTYWNEDSIKRTIEVKKLSKIINKTADFKSMSFDEFNLYLQDYSNKSKFPNINN